MRPATAPAWICLVRLASFECLCRQANIGSQDLCFTYLKDCRRAMAGRTLRNRPIPPEKPFRPRPGLTPQQIEEIRVLRQVPANRVYIHYVEITGPYKQAKGLHRKA